MNVGFKIRLVRIITNLVFLFQNTVHWFNSYIHRCINQDCDILNMSRWPKVQLQMWPSRQWTCGTIFVLQHAPELSIAKPQTPRTVRTCVRMPPSRTTTSLREFGRPPSCQTSHETLHKLANPHLEVELPPTLCRWTRCRSDNQSTKKTSFFQIHIAARGERGKGGERRGRCCERDLSTCCSDFPQLISALIFSILNQWSTISKDRRRSRYVSTV